MPALLTRRSGLGAAARSAARWSGSVTSPRTDTTLACAIGSSDRPSTTTVQPASARPAGDDGNWHEPNARSGPEGRHRPQAGCGPGTLALDPGAGPAATSRKLRPSHGRDAATSLKL